jgi:hypothetical protein
MATAPPDVRSPAPLAGGNRAETDWLASKSTKENSPARRRLQALLPAERLRIAEALVALDRVRLAALIARDDLRAVGLDDEDDIAGAATAKIVALRLILAGRADLADLPRAWPEHASRAAVVYRAERDRRRR